jgi:thiosulfate/3-mercaptopyruvate sulfurtransferase
MSHRKNCVSETLMRTDVLAAHLRDPDFAIFDCRFALDDSNAGSKRYAIGHIPSARYLHFDNDLSSPVTPKTGRHPLPDPERFASLLRQARVQSEMQIVAYDDAGGAYAARLWWLMRWLGHRRVAVLDGGWQQWVSERRPVTADVPSAGIGKFRANIQPGMWVTTADVLEIVRGDRDALVIDARSAARYHGDEEPIDLVAGHIPGAINVPFSENLTADGLFLDRFELRCRYERVLRGWPADQVVSMCGSGGTACHNLLAMEIAGLSGARLYAGSWSEWIRDASRPVARDSQ